MLLFNLASAQQNLVPNPSFEEYTDCPAQIDEFYVLKNWKNFRSTPDYFTLCADSFGTVPCNRAGCQDPATGDAYSGIYGYSYPETYREVIGVQLHDPLIVNQIYYISLKVSPGFGNYIGIRWFSNKLGVTFSTKAYSENTPAPINNFAHIYTNDIVSDTAVWTLIHGTFVADSAYSYLMIGNFFDNANTDTLKDGASSLGAYYYIDDVCVTTSSSGCTFTSLLENIAFDQFIVYPNPVSERLYLEQVYHTVSKVMLYDITGRLVPVSVKYQNKLTEIDISHLQSGLYYLRIESQGYTSIKEVFIQN